MPLSDNVCTITQSIEALDFDIELPCEHSQHHTGKWGHSGPAYYYLRIYRLPCGCEDDEWPEFIYMCKSGYEDPGPITCFVCMKNYPKSMCWAVIGKVKS